MATWLFNNHRMENYSSDPINISAPLYLAITPKNDVFYTVLSRSALAMNPHFRNIVATHVMPQESFRSLIDRLPIWGLTIVAGIMTALVILLVMLIFLLRRRYREKAALSARETENEREKLRLESLQKSADEKNMFFSNISHDMRTPLNAILGYAHLAEKLTKTAELSDYLSKIRLSGTLLLNLSNDTLLVSKISSSKLELLTEPVHTDEINQVLSAAITTTAVKRGVRFSMDDSGLRPRTVQADKLKLQKILLNLLSNAVKFTPSGHHVWYIIKDDPAGAPDPDMVFIIRDEGIGMSEEYQQKLYTPFAQENRDGYESQGTGLGLSIVKQLVDFLGGSITAKSAIGQGTTFTVRLHLPEIQAETAAAASAKPAVPAATLAGKHILLCEDNELNAEIAIELLKNMGLSTDWAKNGQEGLDKFTNTQAGTYDLILMDLRMPILNGFETTERLRSLDRPDARTIPIIAMTADAFEEDVKKCLAAGMNGHVPKPIDLAVLYSKLEKAISLPITPV
jgi:signal transduction histidine kinase